jgi:hypothetical protein
VKIFFDFTRRAMSADFDAARAEFMATIRKRRGGDVLVPAMDFDVFDRRVCQQQLRTCRNQPIDLPRYAQMMTQN